MKYQGSKRLIIKKILLFLLEGRKPGQYYVEPFVGGGNSIMQVTGKRIGADMNPYVIELWKGVLAGKEGKHYYTREKLSEVLQDQPEMHDKTGARRKLLCSQSEG